MSIESVRAYLAGFDRADRIEEWTETTHTVEQAAAAHGVEPGQIAKTLAYRGADPEACILVVMAGDARADNKAFKAAFGRKAQMLKHEEVEPLTGHPVGGVCPFANPDAAEVYLDTSLQRFDVVIPAAGSPNSSIALSLADLERLSRSRGWVTIS